MLGRRRPPTPEEATALLAAARGAEQRSTRAAGQAALRASLVGWGLDWIFGYTLVQVWPYWPSIALWVAVSLGLLVWPRVHVAEAHLLVSGWEARFRRAWWVILGGSAACVVVVSPSSLTIVCLLLGTVWGIAYALYGVLANDRAVVALGGVIVGLAIVARLLAPTRALVVFGVGAGGAATLLGLWRLRREP